jgi:hypothetical protein
LLLYYCESSNHVHLLSRFEGPDEAMIEERIANGLAKRETQWTESIAVGLEDFVREVACPYCR